MVDGARDFRLMTRQMVDAVLELTEYNRFSKGIFSWVGFNTKYLSFENRRTGCRGNFVVFWSLFRYSIDGIVNFSEAPLNIASIVGALSCVGAVVALLFIVIRALFYGILLPAGHRWYRQYAYLSGDYNYYVMGIIGKYIGKIFLETKNAPFI